MKRWSLLGEIASGLGEWLRELTVQPRYFTYAVLVHVAFIVILVMSFEWTPTPIGAPAPQVDVVEAVVIDESKIRQEQARLKQAEERKQAEEKRRRDEQREAREREEERLAQLKQEQVEAKRELELEKQRAQEVERRKQEESEKLAALKKQQDDARRQTEETRKREEQRKKEQDDARKAAEARKTAEARERSAREQSEVDHYVEIIKQTVEREWIKPVQWQGLRCRVRVKLMPGGEVLEVQIVAGSGDPLFDSSVETAVRKASPLPVPSGPLFDRFRELEFVFNPQG